MANNPNDLPWFDRRTVLDEVQLLAVEDNNNAEHGWTKAQIKDSLIARHHDQQQQLPPGFDAEFGRVLSDLLRGDHLVTGDNPQCYKLHTVVPHHLPPWFGKDAVLQEVEKLDNQNNNNDGSTWAPIRNSLLETYHHHQQQQQQLPPGFDRLVRKMLSVLRNRGHLTRGANGPQHYTRRQAPALTDPNPIPMEEFQLGFYLGYTMGAMDGFRNGKFEGMMEGMEF